MNTQDNILFSKIILYKKKLKKFKFENKLN